VLSPPLIDRCGSAITRTTADAVAQRQLPCHPSRASGSAVRDAGYAMRDAAVEVLDGRGLAPVEGLGVPGELQAVRVTGLAMWSRARAAPDRALSIMFVPSGGRCRRKGTRDEREGARCGSEAVLVGGRECALTRWQRMSFRELFASSISGYVFASSRCIHAVMPDGCAGLECARGGMRSTEAVSRFGVGAERDGHSFMALDASQSEGAESGSVAKPGTIPRRTSCSSLPPANGQT
jgi:hypothetical protein